MGNKNLELPATATAVAELSAALASLSNSLEAKKKELKMRNDGLENEMRDREQRLQTLTKASADVMGNIDKIINNLDKALEEDGTSYHNN